MAVPASVIRKELKPDATSGVAPRSSTSRLSSACAAVLGASPRKADTPRERAKADFLDIRVLGSGDTRGAPPARASPFAALKSPRAQIPPLARGVTHLARRQRLNLLARDINHRRLDRFRRLRFPQEIEHHLPGANRRQRINHALI